ncbi:MAG: methyl-accepting chemotaxis protein [Desulfobulbaceae bacterium]|nr:methyl-accepting chemotaxis protein [Desulfobulbaceae bacterium]
MEHPITLQWDLLLPHGSGLFTPPFTAENFSSTIIFFLIGSFFLLIGIVIYKLIKSISSINYLFSLVKDLTPEELNSKRRDILNKAQERDFEGFLWREFNETLVPSLDGKILFNTFDASYFFNTHTLARGLTESRLIAAMPGLFTAVGVLGTFTGLQLGLGSLSLDVKDIQDISKSIEPLIQGASIAFSTSVWGVLCSFLFNLFEKLIEQGLRKKINELQDKIDYLFPRNLAERTLTEIEYHSRESEETLKGLAEQIGVRMQRAVSDMSDKIQQGIQNGIEQSITPAGEQLSKAALNLAEKQEAGASESFERLVREFSDSVSALGQEHQKSLEDVSRKVNSGVEHLGTSMKDFSMQVQEQLQEIRNQDKKRQEVFDQLLKNTNDNWKENSDRFIEQINQRIGSLEKRGEENSRRLDEQVNKMQSAWDNTLGSFLDKVGDQINAWQVNTENLSGSIDTHLAIGKDMIEQSKNIAEESKTSYEKIEQVTDNLVTAAGMIESAASSIKELGKEFSHAAEAAKQDFAQAVQKIEEASRANISAAETFDSTGEIFSETTGMMEETVDALKEAALKAMTGFEKMSLSQDEFLEGLNDRIGMLQKNVADMLDDYSQRVQSQTVERLEVWNKHTNEFCVSMKDAVATMNDIVSDIHLMITQSKKNR